MSTIIAKDPTNDTRRVVEIAGDFYYHDSVDKDSTHRLSISNLCRILLNWSMDLEEIESIVNRFVEEEKERP